MAIRFFQNLRSKIRLTLARTESLAGYRKAKATWQKKLMFRRALRSILFILLGVLSATFGLKGFLMPNNFIDGGVTGTSLLINAKTGFSLSVLIVLINIPFILLGLRTISYEFGLRSIAAIALLAFAVAIIPFKPVTEDKLLVAVFGGFFLGAGIGLSIRGGAVIDGTEILAIFLSRKRSLSVGDFILVFNIIIFSVAAYLLGTNVALYAILTYLSASKTVDFILEGGKNSRGSPSFRPKARRSANSSSKKWAEG